MDSPQYYMPSLPGYLHCPRLVAALGVLSSLLATLPLVDSSLRL